MDKNRKSKHKSHKKTKKLDKKRPSSCSESESDAWVEKEYTQKPAGAELAREDWMVTTGMLKTYTKEDVRPKKEDKNKTQIDSYNPATSSRELNPYWRNGGEGLPQTSEGLRKSRQYLKPSDDDDFYAKSSSGDGNRRHIDDKDYFSKKYNSNKDLNNKCHTNNSNHDKKSNNVYYNHRDKLHNWKTSDSCANESQRNEKQNIRYDEPGLTETIAPPDSHTATVHDNNYLSDEKMNKLGAKIVKAEIMGDMKLVTELKDKLDAAKEYRKQNPNAGKEQEDDRVMLISTSGSGSSRPLARTWTGDATSKGGKRKADTHVSGERAKYFGDDDKYNLAQMFQNEKYGNNYDEEAELARIAAKSKNPNDDLADIFMDEISKNHNQAKDDESEKHRAINQHKKMEKSLEGCEYCLDSRNMLKHLMVSCGSKVYVAVPARTSLVEDHCLIATIQHSSCVTALDEDVWEEIMNYRRALTQMYNSQNMDVVFFETATKLHRYPHMVINCVPLPRDVGDMAAIYFKKALLECEAEWSMNKKVVDLKGKNIRKGIPKGLPYFWVDFGMDPGFAHVIEDQQLFPKTFAEEIIAGILDLNHKCWKNTKREYGDLQRKKIMDFVKKWKSFDPNQNK